MGHARLKSLKIKAFKSFTEETEIQFPVNGLTLLRGHNLDTGGSSGSGKSSVLLAITHLLGFCRYPSTVLQSWNTSDQMDVQGVFEIDKGELVVRRAAGLSLSLNGEAIRGSAKLLEDRLTDLIGLQADLLAALTYRGQKQPGLFLSKTDSEKKEFLTVLLGLNRFETAIEESQKKSKVLDATVATEDFVVADLQKKIGIAKTNLKPAKLTSEATLLDALEMNNKTSSHLRDEIARVRSILRNSEREIGEQAQKRRLESVSTISEMSKEIIRLKALKPDESCLDLTVLHTLEADLAQAQHFLQEELASDQEKAKKQKLEADSIHAQMVLLEKKLAGRSGMEKRLAQLGKDIEKLAHDVCDRCDRPWDNAAAEKVKAEAERDMLSKQLLELEALKPQVQALQEESRRLSAIFSPSPMVDEIRSIIANIQSEISGERVALEIEKGRLASELQQQVTAKETELQHFRLSIAQEIERLQADARERLQSRYEDLENMERQQLMTDTQIKGLTASLSRIQIDNAREAERQAAAEQSLKSLEQELEIATAKLTQNRQALHAEMDFQKLIGREGFLGSIFDEVLWEISDETNRILAQLPNTAHVTLNFRSETSNQKGTVNRSIVPVVSVNGQEAPLKGGLSGGMETAVELAVDLAVSQVVSRRTGTLPCWLILDESFTGLGPVEMETALEILKVFSETRLVLVVDHASESKGLFDQFIDIEYKGGVSRIEEIGTSST
jgi:DNA repair exonuclease SbcCD ATPase subunit